ncbi:alpha/beta fold hydrolase [Leifsonia sp. NPDC058292]|uniref:alpha/beta fold hydrolase n=1 Tax=Leifsonia sp. NPDC058292 TaxID=3346428 RepID=UPI0036DA0DDD
MPDPTERTFRWQGAEMVYTESGTPGRHSFVLVHGIGMGHRVFRDLADVLDEHGRVYAIDLPGFGDSPEPPDAGNMRQSGDLLAAFVREVGIANAVLIGHSMGTQVVVEAVANHPETADAVVLIAPTVNIAERTARLQAWRMVQDVANENIKVLALGLVQYVKAGPRWFISKLRRMLEHRVEETYPRVRARALVLRGEDDRVVPRDWARTVTSLLADATLEEIPDRGHEAMIRSPEPVASMILKHAAGDRTRSALEEGQDG